MKPTNLQPGSLEHALLKDVLLGVNDPRGLTAQMRRSTLRMLLEITDTFGSVPRSEEHTSELQSLMRISYAVFCLKKQTYVQRPRHTSRKYPASRTHPSASINKFK